MWLESYTGAIASTAKNPHSTVVQWSSALAGSPVGGMAAQGAFRKNGVRLASALLLMTSNCRHRNHVCSGNNQVNVKIKGETSEASSVQLYLAAGESDQATSGHIFLDNLRTLMHGLPADVPIMACEDNHAVFTKGAPLQHDANNLSQKQFQAGSELIVWPGEVPSHRTLRTPIILQCYVFCILMLSTSLVCLLHNSEVVCLSARDWF